MATTTTSRRAFLSGAAGLPVAMTATVAACASPAPAPAEPVTADLLALIDQAKAIEDAANHHTYGPLAETEERTDAAIAAVPHIEMAVGENVAGDPLVRTTARPDSVVMNQTLIAMGREGKYPALSSLERSFRGAYLRRERAIKAIRRRSGLSERVAENDALWDKCCKARYAVAGFLVRNPADLAHKLAFMVEHQMGDGMDWLAELLNDARALAGEG